jgi:hypothetical protein
VRVKPEVGKAKLRCPACSATFDVQLRRPNPPGPAEEEGGSYGLARETNLDYLLRREQDGFTLTRDELADKKRLIDERLAADPGECPDCGERKARRDVVCPHCRFNVRTGRRPRLRPEAAAEPTPYTRPPEVFDEEDAEEVVELIVDIISGLLDRDD